jgi:hypothetical protein
LIVNSLKKILQRFFIDFLIISCYYIWQKMVVLMSAITLLPAGAGSGAAAAPLDYSALYPAPDAIEEAVASFMKGEFPKEYSWMQYPSQAFMESFPASVFVPTGDARGFEFIDNFILNKGFFNLPLFYKKVMDSTSLELQDRVKLAVFLQESRKKLPSPDYSRAAISEKLGLERWGGSEDIKNYIIFHYVFHRGLPLLHLSFSDPDSAPSCLELNPSGQWAFIKEPLRREISSLIDEDLPVSLGDCEELYDREYQRILAEAETISEKILSNQKLCFTCDSNILELLNRIGSLKRKVQIGFWTNEGNAACPYYRIGYAFHVVLLCKKSGSWMVVDPMMGVTFGHVALKVHQWLLSAISEKVIMTHYVSRTGLYEIEFLTKETLSNFEFMTSEERLKIKNPVLFDERTKGRRILNLSDAIKVYAHGAPIEEVLEANRAKKVSEIVSNFDAEIIDRFFQYPLGSFHKTVTSF